MVNLSLDDKSVEISVTIQGNDSIFKYSLLDYGIEIVNNREFDPSPKLMDQSNFNIKQHWKVYVSTFYNEIMESNQKK